MTSAKVRRRWPLAHAASGCAFLPAMAFAQTTPAGASLISPWQVISVVLYLAIIGGLAFIIVRFLKGRTTVSGVGMASSRLRVLEVRRVTPVLTLVLAQADERKVLIATTASTVQILPLDKDE